MQPRASLGPKLQLAEEVKVPVIKPTDIEDIRAGTKAIWLFVYIAYTDVFGERHVEHLHYYQGGGDATAWSIVPP
jgi:hypothetical protein